eukprot:TRINITY_DN3458_c0_g1_i1.p3 TRINITY_DN3458_c0_g1~~TRINITY_DN3458_c0_g1_i1.p3  ORF type:complete len:137 (-),score=7.76 TRINITY_DN3458_c0_g1_i1:52-462(-)
MRLPLAAGAGQGSWSDQAVRAAGGGGLHQPRLLLGPLVVLVAAVHLQGQRKGGELGEAVVGEKMVLAKIQMQPNDSGEQRGVSQGMKVLGQPRQHPVGLVADELVAACPFCLCTQLYVNRQGARKCVRPTAQISGQ